MKQKDNPGQKIICLNRKASFNYFFLETLEAGIALKGSEVKSLRDGKASIADSYAIDKNGEIFLINSHIPLYKQSSYNNHDPKGDRKLLFKRKKMTGWELSLGLYPGVLIGVRSYVNKETTDHVLYIPFVELCLTIYKDE